jgi:hypothetical protein
MNAASLVTIVTLAIAILIANDNLAAEKKPTIREMWRKENLKPEQRQQLAKMICLDNLKQLASGANKWAATNGGALPSQWSSLEKFVSSPELLTCFADTNRIAVTEWSQLRPRNITYPLLSPGAKKTSANTAITTCPLHGHVVLTTGQAFQGDYIKEKGLKMNGNKLE